VTQPPPMTHKGFSKTAKIVIAIIVVTCVAVASTSAVLLSRHLQTQNNNPQNNNNPNDNTTPLRVVLKVDGGVTNGYWTRDVATDLPDYESTVSYSVSDVGNLDASSVSITISIDGKPYSSNIIPSITTSTSYSSSFSYSTPHDQTDSVLIRANCQDSSDSYTLSIGSTFPSSPYASGFSPTIAECLLPLTNKTW